MTLKRPPTPERLQQAAQLLEDGVSQREVQRTTGIARETLRKHFPGKGWTFVEGGEFRALTRADNDDPWKLPVAFHNWAEKRRMRTVISLCDLTGNMVQPWIEAGYHAILVDPQHGHNDYERRITKLAGTIEESMEYIGHRIRHADIAMVFGFPPCTDMAVSGARWFEAKRAADRMFQAKAVMVAEQCRTIGRLSGAPYMVENPVSVLASAFGKPQHTFHPADYTAYEPGDNYTKKTCLWTGGGLRYAAAI